MEEERLIIAFYKVPLKVDYEQLKEVILDNNELLNDALNQYLEEIADNIEIWLVENNIAVTEIGYFIALDNTNELQDVIKKVV